MSCYWKSYWALEETRIDPSVLFRELPRFLPEATALYLEGTSIDSDVKEVLLSHAQAGPYLPDPNEPYPILHGELRNDCFRCEFSPALLMNLEHLAEIHAEPELCDHLFVYVGNEPVFEFYDFPENEIWLPIKMSEERVRTIASVLNTAYWKVDSG